MAETFEESFYNKYCHHDFIRIEKDIKEVRERVFNGLSNIPKEVEWLRRTLIAGLLTIILGGGAGLGVWIYRLGRLESRVDAQIEIVQELVREQKNVQNP